MKSLSNSKDYLKALKQRSSKSHIYKRFQLIGLLIAMHLKDEKHKSLYMKMAKEGDADSLLALAKSVSERTKIENKGGYFMRILDEQKKKDKDKKQKPKIDKKKK